MVADYSNATDIVGPLGGPGVPTDYDDVENVLFADGHSSNEKRADVGITNDNIWTFWTGNTGAWDERRIGSSLNPTSFSPFAMDDSLLVNDGLAAESGP